MLRDKATDGSGGFAMIKSGGINYRNAVVYFKSQTGGDIRFTVDIYCQPVNSQPYYQPNAVAHPAGWVYPPQNNYPQQNNYPPQNNYPQQNNYQPQYSFNRN